MAEYKLFNNLEGKTGGVVRDMGTISGAHRELYIPLDPTNTDYQVYLEWAKSNTPDAAD